MYLDVSQIPIKVDNRAKRDRTAADMAVFNVLLRPGGGVDAGFKEFAAIGATYLFRDSHGMRPVHPPGVTLKLSKLESGLQAQMPQKAGYRWFCFFTASALHCENAEGAAFEGSIMNVRSSR